MTKKITGKELALVAIFALIGWYVSQASFIKYLDGLSLYSGFLIYYAFLYGFLLLLSKAGLIIGNIKIDKPMQLVGLILITFSFFLIFNFENPYVQFITEGNMDGASQIFYYSEDGITWNFWSNLLPGHPVEHLRLLTFVLTPALLTLIGVYLVERRIELL